MSRTSKPAAADPSTHAEAPIEGQPPAFAVDFGEIPAVMALNALIAAVVALASFPSSPVPDALLQNLDRARRRYVDALKEPVLLPAAASDPDDAYDDAWIKTDLAALGEQLKDRFAALDAAFGALTKSVAEVPSVDLSDIEARLAALETAPPVDLSAIDGRLSAVETAHAAAAQAATQA